MNQIYKISLAVVVFIGFGLLDTKAQNSPNGSNGLDDASDVFVQFQGLPTFREIPWGAKKEYVLRNDNAVRKETGKDYLVLRDRLGELTVDVTYFFWRNHFVKGTYLSTNNLQNYSAYLQRYENLKRLISQKYGEPILDITNWIDVTYRNNNDQWLRALSRGHLEHFAFWKKDKLIISVKLSSVNDRPAIKVEYYIQNFDSKMEETDDKEVLSDL